MALAITADICVMYLLDTNVISELRRPTPHTGLVAWLSGIEPEQLFISAVTLGELQGRGGKRPTAGCPTGRDHRDLDR
jgi:predicted nucleic acid-binding protein